MISHYKHHIRILDQLTSNPRTHDFDFIIVNRVLYIGGTDSFHDWLSNFKVLPKSHLHSGFYCASKSVLRQVSTEDVDLIVGYSLGAAIANCVALSTGIPCIGFATPGFTSERKLKLPEGSINFRHLKDPIWLTPYFVPNLKVIGSRGVMSLKYHSLTAYH